MVRPAQRGAAGGGNGGQASTARSTSAKTELGDKGRVR